MTKGKRMIQLGTRFFCRLFEDVCNLSCKDWSFLSKSYVICIVTLRDMDYYSHYYIRLQKKRINEIDRWWLSKAKLLLKFRSNVLHRHFYLPEVDTYTGPKWQRSTWQPSSINFRHGTSLLKLHGHFGPVYLLQVSKNDGEEHCFLK